ncbi:uncharacterized protein LOC126327281 [Schistocerca gregaria]|uniref:uncharacterized protein LOC126327281 n=1 Tax=Schistocerca gregaria TaxID=7010 RepID=UPI00211EB106|nr:uncharacterized protein LOC126327281 [Schistocerca gregaria]
MIHRRGVLSPGVCGSTAPRGTEASQYWTRLRVPRCAGRLTVRGMSPPTKELTAAMASHPGRLKRKEQLGDSRSSPAPRKGDSHHPEASAGQDERELPKRRTERKSGDKHHKTHRRKKTDRGSPSRDASPAAGDGQRSKSRSRDSSPRRPSEPEESVRGRWRRRYVESRPLLLRMAQLNCALQKSRAAAAALLHEHEHVAHALTQRHSACADCHGACAYCHSARADRHGACAKAAGCACACTCVDLNSQPRLRALRERFLQSLKVPKFLGEAKVAGKQLHEWLWRYAQPQQQQKKTNKKKKKVKDKEKTPVLALVPRELSSSDEDRLAEGLACVIL